MLPLHTTPPSRLSQTGSVSDAKTEAQPTPRETRADGRFPLSRSGSVDLSSREVGVRRPRTGCLPGLGAGSQSAPVKAKTPATPSTLEVPTAVDKLKDSLITLVALRGERDPVRAAQAMAGFKEMPNELRQVLIESARRGGYQCGGSENFDYPSFDGLTKKELLGSIGKCNELLNRFSAIKTPASVADALGGKTVSLSELNELRELMSGIFISLKSKSVEDLSDDAVRLSIEECLACVANLESATHASSSSEKLVVANMLSKVQAAEFTMLVKKQARSRGVTVDAFVKSFSTAFMTQKISRFTPKEKEEMNFTPKMGETMIAECCAQNLEKLA
jgi:hypothetical protein